MKKLFELQRKRTKQLFLSVSVLLSGNVVIGQFGTAAPTSSTSNSPLTINAVYVGRGFYQAGTVNTFTNLAIGSGALAANTLNSYNNTAVGVNTLSTSYDAVGCVALGNGALRYANGNDNTALGTIALGALNNTGIQNVAVGGGSLSRNTGGNYNTAVGLNSLLTNETGYANVAIGHAALYNNDASAYNTAIGYQSLKTLGTGGANTSIGSHALWLFTGGNYNTAVGCSTMVYKTSGDYNTVFGHGAYGAAGSGSNNCAFGNGALGGLGSGNFNVGIGSGATVTNGGNNQLSIQNAIYGINMTAGNVCNVGIGVQPSGTLARLEVGGTLKINSVPSVTNTTNTYMWRGTDGIINQSNITDIGAFWNLTGNTATVPGTGINQNYLGTRDGQRLVIATNATERMTVMSNTGHVGIGTNNPAVRLAVVNNNQLAGMTSSVTTTQTQVNAADAGDGAFSLGYTLNANSAGNELVTRVFSLGTVNNLTGGGRITHMRVFDLANTTNAGTTTDNLDALFIGNGNVAAGNVTNSRSIRLNTFQGTNQAGIAINQMGGTNHTYSLLGTILIPAGNYGVFQSVAADNNYFAGNVGIGAAAQAPTASLHVSGAVRFQNLPVNPGTIPNLGLVLIDPVNGNLYRSIGNTPVNRPVAPAASNTELENKVTQLEDEIKSLRSLVELIMGTKQNMTTNQQFNIYPNPATNNIRIEPNNNTRSAALLTAEVRDMSNRVIITQALANKSATINLNQNLANGTYLVAIYEDGKIIQTEKIQVFK